MSLLLLFNGAGGGGTPQSSTFPDLVVQFGFDAGPSTPLAETSWTNIPLSYIRGISTNRGRSVETDDFQAGTCDLVLSNALRTFDPDYTSGPYYGKLLPLRRVRVLANYAGTTYPLFNGFTPDEWPQEYDGSNHDSTVTLRCVDGFFVLNQAETPASVLAYEQSVDSPKGQWSLADGSVPVTASDSSGNGYDGTYEGVLTSASSLAYGGDGAVTFAAGSTIDLPYASLLANPSTIGGNGVTVEAIYNWDSDSTAAGQVYFQLDAPGSFSVFLFQISGNFGIADTGSSASNTGQFSSGIAANDGVSHHILGVIAYDTVTTTRTLTMYVDGVAFTGSAIAGSLAVGVPAGASIIGANGRFANTWTGTLDDVATFQSALSAGRVAAHYDAAFTPWNGDLTGARIARLLTVAGWPTDDRNLDTGNSVLGSQAFSGTPLGLIKEIEASEQGRFFISADGLATFQNRYVSVGGSSADATSTSPQAVFGDTGGPDLPYFNQGFRLKKAPIRNVVTGERDGGATITLKDSDSVDTYGPQRASFPTLQNTNDAEIRGMLEHQLARWAQPVTICDGIEIRPQSPRPAYSVTATDTFTRADSTTTLGTAEAGGTWTDTGGTWGIVSNTAYYTSAGTSLALLPLASDGTIQVTLSTMQNEDGLAFRARDGDNYWRLVALEAFASYGLYKVVDGTETPIGGTGATTPTNGDVLKVVTSGSTIQCYINGVLVRTDTDTALMNEHMGGLHAVGPTIARWDSFSFTGSRTAAQLQTELWDAVLGMEISKRYTLKRLPQGVGNTINFDVLLEGVAHHIDAGERLWHCTPYFSAADTRTDWLILDTGVLDTNVLAF